MFLPGRKCYTVGISARIPPTVELNQKQDRKPHRSSRPGHGRDRPRQNAWEKCLTPSHRMLFVPSAEQYAVSVLSAMGREGLKSASLACFLSSLRRFISAAFSSLVRPTRLGCVEFTATGCGVGDRLGPACLEGVIARRGITIKGLIQTHWLAANYESTHSQLAPAMVPLQVVRYRSHAQGRVRFRMHLDHRSPSADSRRRKTASHSSRPDRCLRP